MDEGQSGGRKNGKQIKQTDPKASTKVEVSTPESGVVVEFSGMSVDLAAVPSSSGNGKGGGGGSGGGGSGGGGSGGGGRPGGGEEGVGNNLSFPVIAPLGVPLFDLRGDMDSLKLTDPYFVPGEYDANYWFDQKNEGNEWQAYNEQATEPIAIHKIDMGDALESARISLGRFVRIELALLRDVDGWLAYNMENIDGQGKTEVQGTPLSPADYPDPSVGLTITDDLTRIEALNGPTYRSDLATVYAPSNIMNLTIQKFEDDPVTGLLWNGEQWVGEGIGATDYAAGKAFGAELTVSGKVISGVSGKPFKFTEAGNYRITFEIEQGASIFLDEFTEAYNVAGARVMDIIPDGEMSYGGVGADTHNGLIVLDVEAPSTVAGDELTSQFSRVDANASYF
jgi:hypothetical protein